MGETFDEAMMMPKFAKFVVKNEKPVDGIKRTMVTGVVIGQELGTEPDGPYNSGEFEMIEAKALIIPTRRFIQRGEILYGYSIEDLLTDSVLAKPEYWREIDL